MFVSLFSFSGGKFMKRKMLWSTVAVLPLLAVAVVFAVYHQANAATPVVQAKTVKAVDCCEDPTCPPGCTPECAANCLDCCLDPTCLPGCPEDCPPNCCDVASVKTTAKTTATVKTAKKTACYSEGSECCPDEACCPASTVTATAKTPQKKYICPPCPFCPGW